MTVAEVLSRLRGVQRTATGALHRKPMQPETDCMVAKNRDGRTGIVKLAFRAEFVAFDEAPEEGRR